MQHQNLIATSNANSKTYEDLLDHICQGILSIDSQGMIRTYNLTAEKILGQKKEFVLNSPFSKYFDDLIFGFSIQKALKEKKVTEFLVINPYMNLKISTNNKPQSLEIKCFFNNETLNILFLDVTKAKETEQLAHASNRLKDLGAMTAMLAHEIRNPLGGIKGFASLLRKDLEKEPNLRQMAELIIDGTDHLNRLVTHILNFAHPLAIKFKSVDLVSLSHKLKKTVESDPALNKQEIVFEIKSTSDAIYLPIDEELLFSCLLNLVINAIQAMPKGGLLSIFIEETKDLVKIQVKDTGIGIPKENFEKIFTAFFTTKKDGNGFGLLEVYKVVQAHKGTVDVESVVDTGTTFTIKIPIPK